MPAGSYEYLSMRASSGVRHPLRIAKNVGTCSEDVLTVRKSHFILEFVQIHLCGFSRVSWAFKTMIKPCQFSAC